MSSYSATLISKTTTNELCTGAGSFSNISIDGRLSLDSAIDVARECFKKETTFKNSDYLGFAIEKTSRFVDYKTPLIVDNSAKATDIAYLL